MDEKYKGQLKIIPSSYPYQKLFNKYNYHPVNNNRWLIYTTNIGHYDNYDFDHNFKFPFDCDYVIYKDKSTPVLKHPNWKCIDVPIETNFLGNKDNTLTSRKYKIPIDHIMDDYGYSLYFDCNIGLDSTIDSMVVRSCNFLKDNNLNMVALQHPKRRNYEEEAVACMKWLHKNYHERLKLQVKHYNEIGLNKAAPFIYGGLLIRRHNSITNKVCSTWYKQLEKFQVRDQVSWQYSYNRYTDRGFKFSFPKWSGDGKQSFEHKHIKIKQHRR